MSSWVPSTFDRLRAGVVGAPRALWHALVDVSESFEPGEGGTWAWYPTAGSFSPFPLDRVWSLRGRGGALVGSLTQSEGRARFVPSTYWRSNGISDWETTVDTVERRGRWMRLDSPQGSIVVRRTGNVTLNRRRGA